MPTSTEPGREILLRREDYGGFLFHPADATFIHLDPPGFAVALAYFRDGREPDAAPGREFLEQLCAALPGPVAAARHLDLRSGQPALVSNQLSAPTLVDFQITESCDLACPQCYVSARPEGRHASWEDACLALTRMREAGVCQVAIGGGEPLRHPRLADILAETRNLGMTPNITTTGIGMTAAALTAMARHCGAVALSLEGVDEAFSQRRRQGFAAFQEQAQRLIDAGIRLVLQITLSADNIEELPRIVEYARSLVPLYGVIFLAHKPAGRAELYDAPLSARPFADIYPTIREAVHGLRDHTQVGFDCCFSPLLAALEQDLGYQPTGILEGCSATRGSLGLSVDLDCMPCTFLPAHKLGNLREQSLLEIWRAAQAQAFRRLQGNFLARDARCAGCAVNPVCLGGCPVWDLVGCRHTESRSG